MKQTTHVLDSSWCLGSGASDLERLELAKIPLFHRELFFLELPPKGFGQHIWVCLTRKTPPWTLDLRF